MPRDTPHSLHTFLAGKIETLTVSLKVSGAQLPLGNGALHCRNQLMKLNWDCDATTSTLTQKEREEITAFMTYHQHQTGQVAEAFQWYPGPIERRRNKVLIGFGDGSNKDFFLPNDYWADHRGTDTLVYVNGALQTETTHWSHVPGTANDLGQIRFVTAPADDAKIEASYAYQAMFSFVTANGVMASMEASSGRLYKMRFRAKMHTGQSGRPAYPQP